MNVLFINEDLKPKQLPNFLEISQNNITIFHNNGETFGIKILVGDANIYSVDSSFIEPKVSIEKTYNNDVNNSFTIYPLTDEVLICLTGLDGEEINYQLYFKIYEQPQHYEDILTNKHLPEYDELKECILFTAEFDKTNLVARMLLDSANLLKYKGTLIGIKKFLNFVGFIDDTFSVNREYKTPDDKITFTPNKATDIATGNYSIWINNYLISNTNKFTRKNLPNFINLINDQSIDDFVEKLRRSFAIAMKYFTLDEQDISFIGFNNMSNGMKFVSVAGNMNMFVKINPQLFAKNVRINVYNYFNSEIKKAIVLENIQTNTDTYKTELKYLLKENVKRDIFVIEDEIFDDEIEKLTFDHKRIFGTANHIHIDSDNTYVEVEITGIDNRLIYLKIPKQFVGDSGLIIKYICTQSGRFNIKVTIWDLHNNREVYNFVYRVDNKVINADFNIFTSHELIKENIIDLDITSSTNTTVITDNIVLDLDAVPDDLSEYYNNVDETNIVSYLTNNSIYKLPPINSNISIDYLTVLPIDFIDNFLNIISFPIDLNVYTDIVLRPKSLNKDLNKNGSYFKLEDVYSNEDNFEVDDLFITTMKIQDINDPDDITDYLFISTTESGVDIVKKVYDLGLLDVDGNVTSIYDLPEFRSKKLPVNYDFELFHRADSIADSKAILYPKIFDKPVAKILSLYPRLLDISMESKTKANLLKIGDVIVASINTDTIVGQLNMNWKIYNSFTGELIYNTNDYALKYRINENVLYTIVLELDIDSYTSTETYIIDAKNAISSFNFNN